MDDRDRERNEDMKEEEEEGRSIDDNEEEEGMCVDKFLNCFFLV
jgi:hypothetical protein